MTLYEYAKHYVEIGWSVIPVNQNKIPAVKEVIPYRTRYATDEELHQWFDDSNNGIALITGELSKVMVIDDDSVKKTGIGDEMLKRMNSSVMSKTMNGGRHLFLKYESGLGNNVNINGKHIDIRTQGGYVLIPPTQFGDKKYEWISEPTPENLFRMPSISATPEIESAIKIKPTTAININDYLFLGKGSRDDGLFRLARSLLNRIPKADVWEMIKGIGKNYDPPLDDATILKKFEQAVRYYEEDKKIRTKQPKKSREVAEERLKDRLKEREAPSTGYYALDRLVDGFIGGNLYCLTGETNVGKTTVACNFAMNVAAQDKKVLYIALETGSKVVEVLASIRTKKYYVDLTDEDILYDDKNIDLFVDRDIVSVKDLKETIENLDQKYDLIIIDHIGYFVTDKVNFLQEQANILKELRFITKESKTAIMIIAHLRKRGLGQKENYVPSGDDISGTAAFKQDSTDVFIVVRKKDESDPYKIKYTNEGILYVVKTKGRSTGVVHLKFRDEFYGRCALIEEVNE